MWRRASAATPKRLQEGPKDTGSDENWETEDDEGEEEAVASESKHVATAKFWSRVCPPRKGCLR